MQRTLCLSLVLVAIAASGCNPRTDLGSATTTTDPARTAPSAATAPPAAPPESAQPAPATEPAATSSAFSDTVITARAKAAILSDPGMTGSDVSVNTDHGVVSLTGTIKSQEQSAIASAHAQRQDGVLRVDNHLAANLQ